MGEADSMPNMQRERNQRIMNYSVGVPMSLAKIIAKLEVDESIKFTRDLHAICCVIKKGDESGHYKQINVFVDQNVIEKDSYDVLASELNQALHNIRK